MYSIFDNDTSLYGWQPQNDIIETCEADQTNLFQHLEKGAGGQNSK